MRNIVFFITLLLVTSCVSRTRIPLIEGYIYNSERNPLSGVKVCVNNDICTDTDEQGYFFINRITYKEMTFIGGEAPAVVYDLSLSKKEYSDTIIHYKNLYGGANTNLKVKYDTLILKKSK
jgi:hypothetical protein